MPLTDTEWGVVTAWVRDYLLDTPDPHDRLRQAGYPPAFIGSLSLTAKAGDNAAALVRAVRQSITAQLFLLDVLLTLDELTSQFQPQVLALRVRIADDERVHVSDQDHFRAGVLRNGAEVFIDRAQLRERLREFLADPEKTVLVVDGEPDSGRSYSYSLIRYLGQHCGFRPVRVTLTHTTTAARLIRQIAARLNPEAEPPQLNPTPLNDPLSAHEWAVQQIVTRATAAPEAFWIILDECDRLASTSDAWDAIGQLAQALFEHGPEPEGTAPRLVLLGYPGTMPQLPYEIRKTVCRDTARILGRDDVDDFFRTYFTQAPVPPAEALRLAAASAAAVWGAAQAPASGDSLMRRLCTAAETAVGAWRSLAPGADYAGLLHRELGAPAALEPAAPSEERRAYRQAACLLVRFEPDTLRLPGEAEPSGRAQQELVDDCTTLTTNPPVWTLRDDTREAALADLPGPAAARRCLEANLAQVQAGPAPERIALAYLSGRPPDAGRLDADALAAAHQAVLWLSRIPGTAGIPDPGQLERLLERVRLLQPLRRLLEE
ncbi:hypothetical protein [Streptomyces sp. 2P-4]|uniref:hypothetical protein n=1 Tax=Streptomyces sp. 2P-4 TaxID=2931974 RepID=UPI0025411152|nr:hypothetical protein [Streptomyces sp. 2P-4]